MYEEERFIEIKPEAIQSLCASKKFSETSNKLIELAYSEDGQGAIVSAEDIILAYNLRDCTKAKPIECKKYGVDKVEYLTNDTCVHSDPKTGVLRLLNIPKKSYIRYLFGHSKPIRMIRSFPKQREKLLSSSLDGAIRMFDSRSYGNFGFIHIGSTPLVAFDPEGVLIAVATKSQTIKLFDMRSFDLGPFATFRFQKIEGEEWTDIEFTACGKYIIISTNAESVKWINAVTGKQEHNFCQHKNTYKIPLRASVSVDSSYLMVGSTDRNIYVYSTQTGEVSCKLPTPYQEPSHVVAFNHHQFLVTSLGRDVILWAPSEEYMNS